MKTWQGRAHSAGCGSGARTAAWDAMMLQRRGEPRPRSAFSMAELVCVIVILSIMTAIAVPRFSGALARQRVEAAARRIVADLALARRHAKTSSAPRKVKFELALGEYQLSDLPHPDHPGLVYKVFLTEEPYGASLVSADFGGDVTIVFDMYGMPGSGGSVVIRVGKHVRTISVDPDTGEASVQ
jgi:prepilin-type N-terminal cleavage/methylation domain-containing protein